MTNVLLLPKFSGDGTEFAIATNSDWTDAIFFTGLGSPTTPTNLIGSVISGSNVITVPSAAALVPGQAIAQVPGIPEGAYIGATPDNVTVTMVDIYGGTLVASVTDASIQLTFEPLPLDITGIGFRSQIRKELGGTQVYLSLSTDDGTLMNGGKSGVLSFNVTQAQLDSAKVFPGIYVLDILAIADGHVINLFPEGPGTILIEQGVTSPS